MKRTILMSVLFLLVLLTSVVVHVPASLVFRYVPPVDGLDIDGVTGTVWNGKAANFRWQGQPLGAINWQFNALKLLMGNADLAVRLYGVPGFSARGNVGYGLGGAYASDLLFSMPAHFVQSFIPYPLPVSLTGQFDLTLRDYQLQQPFCDVLDGTLAWSQGNVMSPMGAVDPGLVMANLSCDAGSVLVNGDSDSEAIQTEFSLSLSPDQQYSVSGWFIPGDGLPAGMKSQLGWLGAPDSEGRYRLSFNG
ncbi:type II secretion system protein N [Enterovibrio calviensis]|uniref:type II secretion system protein N n=1 Tax=Enterovibrio calviensis TaxID=91359 RepID=UPI003736DCF0